MGYPMGHYIPCLWEVVRPMGSHTSHGMSHWIAHERLPHWTLHPMPHGEPFIPWDPMYSAGCLHTPRGMSHGMNNGMARNGV